MSGSVWVNGRMSEVCTEQPGEASILAYTKWTSNEGRLISPN